MTRRDRIILVVDDEERIRKLLETSFGHKGYKVRTAADGDAALEIVDAGVDLVITDLRMPGMDGMTLLSEIRARGLTVPVIIMTAYSTVDVAVDAMRNGAFDYVSKPFDLDELEMLVERAFQLETLTTENRMLRESQQRTPADLVGESKAMHALFEHVRRVAGSRAAVLIQGETGTGKERVARAIHELSQRRDELFVAVNCAAIPMDLLESELFGHTKGAFTGASENRMGKFEAASGGTLFLDEIGDMPLPLQAKILRALEEGIISRIGSNREIEVDVRVVSATHRRLEDRIAEGSFREDLYYRLNVIQVRVPPVREREGDVRLLATHFLRETALQMGRSGPLLLEDDAVELLEAYAWPGNVRELRNVCERLSVLCDGERADMDMVSHLLDLPVPAGLGGRGGRGSDAGGDSLESEAGSAASTQAGPPTAVPRTSAPSPAASSPDGAERLQTLADAVGEAERRAISAALVRSGDNKAKAARLLEVSERTLWYKIKKYRLG
jgi:two-component system response regulator AtoC